jgi:hypothetical protein
MRKINMTVENGDADIRATERLGLKLDKARQSGSQVSGHGLRHSNRNEPLVETLVASENGGPLDPPPSHLFRTCFQHKIARIRQPRTVNDREDPPSVVASVSQFCDINFSFEDETNRREGVNHLLRGQTVLCPYDYPAVATVDQFGESRNAAAFDRAIA